MFEQLFNGHKFKFKVILYKPNQQKSSTKKHHIPIYYG
ncbi:MAG: Unknown protein [uncultured Sulfurovum sp.]|uniref:Uncharacterized protein n=1 Tax=uncultured Sulfurovum sp. TaxID=269237 RepID=A0A6S6SLM3_9BACT|nr:MAG: Unknown protein [uncultured Sulfurovum sp.]